MPKVVIKYFYNEIKYLAEQIGEIGLPEKILSAARRQDSLEMQALDLSFQKEYPEIYFPLIQFFEDYISEGCPEIFQQSDNNKRYIYDPDEIDPINLCILIGLSWTKISDDDLFVEPEVLQEALLDSGEEEIAIMMNDYSLQSLEDLVVAFAEADEYYEEGFEEEEFFESDEYDE